MTGRVGSFLRVLLRLEDTPHRVALAFGIGVWIAFCPLLGIHTGLALAVAFGFRLSRVAILIGAYVNNPWTLAPLYLAGTVVGCVLLGVPVEGLLEADWSGGGRALAGALLHGLRPYLWPFVVGNVVLGTVAGGLSYLALRSVLERRAAGAAGPGQ